jgi:hypothetical protein
VAESIKLLKSEEIALEALKSRLKAVENTRVPTLILSGHGAREDRLCILLRVLVRELGGQFCDLTLQEVIARLRSEPPLYGRRTIAKHLSANTMRQFIQREINAQCASLLSVYVPSTVWKIMADTHPYAPSQFLQSLFEWTSPCNLVVSYSWGMDASLPNIEELTSLPTHHIVKLALTDAESMYLDDERERTAYDER